MNNQVEQKVSSENGESIVSHGRTGSENGNCAMVNGLRGCMCNSEYHKTRRWADGRTRITKVNPKGCEEYHIMLRLDGTYQIHDEALYRTEALGAFLYSIEGLDGVPEEERKGLSDSEAKKLHNSIAKSRMEEKKQRVGCKLAWDGKVYSFGGYY